MTDTLKQGQFLLSWTEGDKKKQKTIIATVDGAGQHVKDVLGAYEVDIKCLTMFKENY